MKKNINISTEKLKRLYYIKLEIRKLILKSLVLNKNIKNNYRLYANLQIRLKPKRASISKQHKVCLINGNQRGIFNNFNLSRHALKTMGLQNRLQNVKTQSW
jgi:ribosomal protein S14